MYLKKMNFPGQQQQRSFSTSTCLRFSEIVYKNVDKKKQKIWLENQLKSGIYCFTNLINGKKYVDLLKIFPIDYPSISINKKLNLL